MCSASETRKRSCKPRNLATTVTCVLREGLGWGIKLHFSEASSSSLINSSCVSCYQKRDLRRVMKRREERGKLESNSLVLYVSVAVWRRKIKTQSATYDGLEMSFDITLRMRTTHELGNCVARAKSIHGLTSCRSRSGEARFPAGGSIIPALSPLVLPT
jgi:hypothetical protein